MNHTTSLQNLGLLLARFFLALVFILAGWSKLQDFSFASVYLSGNDLLLSDILLTVSIIIELGGGLLILLGWHARLAAGFICVFLIPVTFIFHPYWSATDAVQYQTQFNHFYKSAAIFGGMLYIMILGPGQLSLGQSKPPKLTL